MPVLERVKHDIYPFIDPTKALSNAAKNKSILVTGGSKGIGKAIARHFALAGASRVVITGRSVSALEAAKTSIREASPATDVDAVGADMTDVEAVQRLYEGLGTVPDVVVNNVGAAACQAKLVDGDPGTWWGDYETNVKATYLSTRMYLRQLAGKPGTILNVSSSVSTTTNEGLSSYASAKTAINRFTEFVHLEHSKQGVRCVAFHPGGILDTGMGETAPDYFKPYLYDSLDLPGGTAVYLSTSRAGFLDGRFVFSNYDMERLEGLKDVILEHDLLKSKVDFGDCLGSGVVPPEK